MIKLSACSWRDTVCLGIVSNLLFGSEYGHSNESYWPIISFVTITVGCIYPWTLALKTCFQLTSNVYVSGVKLWSFPTQTRAYVISNVYISGVKLWIFSAQTLSSLDRVSALVVHCHRSLENMRKTCKNHQICGEISKFDTWNIDVWGHVSLSLGGETSKFDT